MPDFNSAEYAWKDMEIVTQGRSLARVLEIEYTVKSDKKHIYGRGKKPRGIQTGNEAVSGSITLGQSEVEAMQRKLQETDPTGKLTDVIVDINVAYELNGEVVRDRIVSVGYTELKKGMKQGDTDQEIKMPFLALDILYNI